MSEDRSRAPLFRPTYRLIGFSLVAGAFGALAAVGFDALVELAQRSLLTGVGGYEPPAVGTLTPNPHPLRPGRARGCAAMCRRSSPAPERRPA